MGRFDDAYRLRVEARSLCLMARSVRIAARDIVADSRMARAERWAFLKRLRASRLYGPLPKSKG